MSTDLLPLDISQAPARRDALAPDLAALVERVLTDPNADVAKLSALLDVNERILNRAAKAAFDSAYALMQPALPEIDEKGAIKKRDGSVQSRYARYEDIQTAVRPVLTTHGFSLRHRTEWPADKPGIIRIVGILSHCDGHSEESAFEAKADASDFRSEVQSQGSTISYGKRYTTCDLLNIITRGIDNDGQGDKAQAPDGYDAWWTALQSVAENGFAELEQTFKASKAEYKAFTLNKRKDALADLKRKASAVRGAK
jgi:hypothetical protein